MFYGSTVQYTASVKSTEYKPNRPLRSVGSSQLEIPGFTQNKGSPLLASLPPRVGISFQKRSDVLKH